MDGTGAGSGSGSGGSDGGEGPSDDRRRRRREEDSNGQPNTPPQQRQSVQSASVDGGTVQFHGGESVGRADRARQSWRGDGKPPTSCWLYAGLNRACGAPRLAVAVLVTVVRTLLRTAPLALLVRVGLALFLSLPACHGQLGCGRGGSPGRRGEGGVCLAHHRPIISAT